MMTPHGAWSSERMAVQVGQAAMSVRGCNSILCQTVIFAYSIRAESVPITRRFWQISMKPTFVYFQVRTNEYTIKLLVE